MASVTTMVHNHTSSCNFVGDQRVLLAGSGSAEGLAASHVLTFPTTSAMGVMVGRQARKTAAVTWQSSQLTRCAKPQTLTALLPLSNAPMVT